MGSPTAVEFDLESFIFGSLVSRAKLGHMLTSNRKAYMGSLMAHSHLTFSDFERSKSRSLIYCMDWYKNCMIYIYIC